MHSTFGKNLLDKIQAALNDRNKQELDEMTGGGNWGQPMGGDWFSKDNDHSMNDVPTPQADTPYYTQYVPKKESADVEDPEDEDIREAVEEEESQETVVDAEPGAEVPEEPMPEEPMPDAGGEGMEGMPGEGMDDMGMPGEEEEIKLPEELGKTYELKKIYARLVSIESYLATSSDINLLKLRNYVSQSIELFSVIISNVKSYKDKINDIIVKYYEFLELVYVLLSKYYKEKEQEEAEDNKGRAI